MEDKDIVSLFQKKNEAAISETDLKYGKKLRAVSENVVQSREDAEECVNDSYYICWNQIPPKDPSEYFLPYLLRIVRSVSLDLVRKASALKRSAAFTELSDELLTCIPCEETVESAFEAEEMKKYLNRFLSELAKEKRMIFVRRYFFMDPVKDIAARFSISESKVKTTLFRVREELRLKFREEGYDL